MAYLTLILSAFYNNSGAGSAKSFVSLSLYTDVPRVVLLQHACKYCVQLIGFYLAASCDAQQHLVTLDQPQCKEIKNRDIMCAGIFSHGNSPHG